MSCVPRLFPPIEIGSSMFNFAATASVSAITCRTTGETAG
jgi:hypothetical protein